MEWGRLAGVGGDGGGWGVGGMCGGWVWGVGGVCESGGCDGCGVGRVVCGVCCGRRCLTLALEHSKVCTLCDFGRLQFK
jgi:hypothetical protein